MDLNLLACIRTSLELTVDEGIDVALLFKDLNGNSFSWKVTCLDTNSICGISTSIAFLSR